MRLAGIDGCPSGWVAIVAEADDFASARLVHVTDLADFIDRQHIDLAVIDIPIGFVDGPEPRDVEAAMRAMLKGKTSSVFSTPCRLALAEAVYFDASYVNRQELQRGLSKQSFMLFPKMREVDGVVRSLGQGRLREGHPEVSFAVMNGGAAVLSRKREPAGRKDRIELLQASGFAAQALVADAPRGLMAADDVLDATALLWSAGRMSRREHITLPPVPSRDAVGLEMSVIA